MQKAGRARVGVAAGDPLRLIGLRSILEESAGVRTRQVTIDEALGAQDLDAVLLDSTCGGDVSETLARFRRERPDVRLVVVDDALESGRAQAVLAAGARAYLPARAREAEFKAAIEAVLAGSVWVAERSLERWGEAVAAARQETSPIGRLTGREIQVLRLLMDGRSNREIARELGIELVTVKAHLGRMLRKAGVKNRVELTLKAVTGSSDGPQTESQIAAREMQGMLKGMYAGKL